MFKQYRERRVEARRHFIAMQAADQARSAAVIYREGEEPSVDDVINLAYGSHGVRLSESEARDALAAELAKYGRRLDDVAAGWD